MPRAWRSSSHGKLSSSSGASFGSGSVRAFMLSASQQTSIRNFIVAPFRRWYPSLTPLRRTRRTEIDRSTGLVLALPVVELRPRPAEEDSLARDAPRADLAAVRVLDDVRLDQRRDHQ